MIRTTRAPLAAALTLALLALAGCGDDEPDDERRTIGEERGRQALLRIEEAGPAYSKSPNAREDTAATGSADGTDCLSRATRDFDSVAAATEVQDGFTKLVAVDALADTNRAAEPGPGDAVQVSVLSKFTSFADAKRAELRLDELRVALQECRTAKYEHGGTTVTFEVSVSDQKTDDALDQQVNVMLDGTIETGSGSAPLTVHLRYFREANNAGAVNVSLLGPTVGKGKSGSDQLAEARERNATAEVERLLGLGVERFLSVAG